MNLPGRAHEKLLEEAIREYKDLGYKQVFDLYFIGYRPDAIMQNDCLIVLIEIVDQNDHPTLILPAQIGPRQVQLDKRYVKAKALLSNLLRVKEPFVTFVTDSMRSKRAAFPMHVGRYENVRYYIPRCDACKRYVYSIYRYNSRQLCSNCILPYVYGMVKALNKNMFRVFR